MNVLVLKRSGCFLREYEVLQNITGHSEVRTIKVSKIWYKWLQCKKPSAKHVSVAEFESCNDASTFCPGTQLPLSLISGLKTRNFGFRTHKSKGTFVFTSPITIQIQCLADSSTKYFEVTSFLQWIKLNTHFHNTNSCRNVYRSDCLCRI